MPTRVSEGGDSWQDLKDFFGNEQDTGDDISNELANIPYTFLRTESKEQNATTLALNIKDHKMSILFKSQKSKAFMETALRRNKRICFRNTKVSVLAVQSDGASSEKIDNIQSKRVPT